MSDYLAGLDAFRLSGENGFDLVLESGQKIQFGDAITLTVRRPEGIYATCKGAVLDQEFFYNGKQLTIFRNQARFYASLDAPTFDDALDTLGVIERKPMPRSRRR